MNFQLLRTRHVANAVAAVAAVVAAAAAVVVVVVIVVIVVIIITALCSVYQQCMLLLLLLLILFNNLLLKRKFVVKQLRGCSSECAQRQIKASNMASRIMLHIYTCIYTLKGTHTQAHLIYTRVAADANGVRHFRFPLRAA